MTPEQTNMLIQAVIGLILALTAFLTLYTRYLVSQLPTCDDHNALVSRVDKNTTDIAEAKDKQSS